MATSTVDIPTITDVYGNKEWYLHGKRHRDGGPAIEYSDGVKAWFLNGKLHREDGPAVQNSDGYKEWYLNNQKLSEEEHSSLTTLVKRSQ
jgi:hypothetical protein